MARAQHPLAGKLGVLRIRGNDPDRLDGKAMKVADWAENFFRQPVADMAERPVYKVYARRAAFAGLPEDGQIVFGQVGQTTLLVHASELAPISTPQEVV